MHRLLRVPPVPALIFLLFLPPSLLAYDWEWTGGPEGGVVFSLLATPTGALLAGTDNGGLFRSDDGGATWTASEDGISWPCCNYTVQALAAGGGAVYAGTWGGGVHRSDDDGLTWSATGTIPGEGYPVVLALAVCRYGDRIYGGGNFGVVRSDDGGGSWISAGAGLPGSWVRGLALRGTTLYAMLDDGVYRLDLGSDTWTLWNEGLYQTYGQQSIGLAGGTVFLATHEGGAFHLDCDDSLWTAMNDGLFDDNVDALVDAGGTLYAGLMGGGAYRCDPETWQWEEKNNGLRNRDVRSMAAGGSVPYAGTYGGGVFTYDPESESWAAGSGMTAPLIRGFAVAGTVLYAGSVGGGVFVSDDQGETWSRSIDGPADMTVHTVAADASGNAYAGTWNGVWKSEDQGASWQESGLQGNGIFSFLSEPSVLYAGTFGGDVRASLDGGASWDPVGSGLPGACVRGLAGVGTTLYAALQEQGVFALPDGETDWAAMNDGLPELGLWSLTSHMGTLFVGLGSRGVYRWNEGSAAWDSSGLDPNGIFCLHDAGSEIFAGGWGQLYASGDGGATWVDEHAGLKEWLAVWAVAGGAENLFAGLDGGGVYRAPRFVGVGGPEGEESLPVSRKDLRVRPNPFASDARVSFALDRPREVRLTVYDTAGRRVRSIHSGPLAAGLHERTWDGRNERGERAAAGVYFIRFESEGEERTIKTARLR